MKKTLLIATAGIALTACQTLPASEDDPNHPSYEAHGTEPFWGLQMAEGTMTFTHPDSPDVFVKSYETRPSFNGNRYISKKIVADVTFAKCSDGMSDFTYKDTVTVKVNGNEYKGCGGPVLPPETMEGTDWLVLSVNNRDVPSQNQAMFAFTDGKMSGGIGCNKMSATYKFANNMLSFGPLMSTKMGCPDYTGSLETDFARILGNVTRTEFTPDGWVVLEGTNYEKIVMKRSG